MTEYSAARKILISAGYQLGNDNVWRSRVDSMKLGLSDDYLGKSPTRAMQSIGYNLLEEHSKLWPNGIPLRSEGYEDWETFVPKPIEQSCYHNWVKYVGLQETFDHCSKCGVKRDNNA